MPCKNGSKTISQAIDSILVQDYIDFELLVIDDGSSDESRKIVADFARRDRRIKLLVNECTGKGVWAARNVGLKNLRGRYVAFLDCDDYLLPNSLSLRIQSIKESGASIVHGPYLRLYPDGRTFYCGAREVVSYRDMLQKNHIGNLTGMYDVTRFGVVLQDDFKHEDYLMWCKLIRLGGSSVSSGSRPLAVYRVSSSSLSGNKLKAFTWRWRVLRKGLQLNLLSAICWQIVSQVRALADRFTEKEVHPDNRA